MSPICGEHDKLPIEIGPHGQWQCMVQFCDSRWSAGWHWLEFDVTHISHTSMINYAQHTLRVV